MIAYAIREMIASFRDGKLRAVMAVTTVSIAMLIFAGFLLLSHNLHVGIDSFRSATKIEVILQDDADALRVAGAIVAMPGVAETKHYSKEEALEYFRQKQGEEKANGITEALGSNPFPAFIEVRLAENVTDPRPLAERIRDLAGVADVLFGRETVERLDKVARVVRVLTWGIGGVMSFFIFLIVVNGIRATVHARRDEIRVLRLIGATDLRIGAPYICEGSFLGLLGSAVGFALLFAAYRFVAVRVPWFAAVFLPPDRILGAVLFAWGLGALGGIIAVRDALNEE